MRALMRSPVEISRAERFETCPSEPIRFHEFANLFPMMQGEAMDGLREDIQANGVREPIVMLDGAILDGRNRYMCAHDLGLEYPVREFDGGDPLAFVVSLNLARRHLSDGQRASIAARIAKLPVGANQHTAIAATSQEAAAAMMNVSTDSLQRAKRVQEVAPPEIVAAMDAGRISPSLAQKVTELPDEDREAVISAPQEQAREMAREAVKRAHVANNSGNNEWYTPAAIIEAARTVLGGFDLDPASSIIANRTVQAERIFTAEDDGLKQEWPVGRIWANPPYAQPLMGQFAERFAAEVRRGSTGIILVNNATETAWFQTIAAECSAICFPRSRVKFLDPEGNPGAPLQGQAIIYCGPDTFEFSEAFSGFGLVVHHGSL